MMDKPIPDEIMREARSIAISLNGFATQDDFNRISRALMARDERAAGIARDQADADLELKLAARKERDGNGALIHAAEEAAARSIATAILSYKEERS